MSRLRGNCRPKLSLVTPYPILDLPEQSCAYVCIFMMGNRCGPTRTTANHTSNGVEDWITLSMDLKFSRFLGERQKCNKPGLARTYSQSLTARSKEQSFSLFHTAWVPCRREETISSPDGRTTEREEIRISFNRNVKVVQVGGHNLKVQCLGKTMPAGSKIDLAF